mmetsp:Transcript_66904/g.211747  ORF Transcript_66904/g.211747 Transcript_66904/m.211747 type:complete len:204 (+) Transcript_66904:463-1074(+)
MPEEPPGLRPRPAEACSPLRAWVMAGPGLRPGRSAALLPPAPTGSATPGAPATLAVRADSAASGPGGRRAAAWLGLQQPLCRRRQCLLPPLPWPRLPLGVRTGCCPPSSAPPMACRPPKGRAGIGPLKPSPAQGPRSRRTGSPRCRRSSRRAPQQRLYAVERRPEGPQRHQPPHLPSQLSLRNHARGRCCRSFPPPTCGPSPP